ncbi:MAG: hypothetical protein AB1696_06945 [Planctomycetota bacterium]
MTEQTAKQPPYVHRERFSREHSMPTFVPNILKIADVPQTAALVAPRPLSILGAVDGSLRSLTDHEMADAFRCTYDVYQLRRAGKAVALGGSAT